MKSVDLLIAVARSAVTVLAFATLGMTPVAMAQEEAPVAEEAPVETIPVENAEAAPAPVAAPASEGATELDTIEVTGSRIRRSDYETAQPILVIKREDIDRAGLVSIGDILQNLPQAGAALSRSFNNGGNGATEIDLRNLGSNRVLVLVNGRRWVGGVSQFNTGGVDLNTIPISVIDSIEILKDGASAVYGSDAIAGVVNIKTRRDYVGAEARSHVESTDRGDGVSQLYSFAGGTVAGKTSVFFDVSYVNQGPLRSGDRKETSIPTVGTGLTRGSSFSPLGRLLFVPLPENTDPINAHAGTTSGPTGACRDLVAGVGNGAIAGETGINPRLPAAPAGSPLSLCDITPNRNLFVEGNPDSVNFVRYDVNKHAYNYAPFNYLITPSERTSIFGQLSHQLVENVRFSTEVLYNIRNSSQELAPTPLAGGDAFGGVPPFDVSYLDETNPYNPTNPQSPYYIPGTTPQDIGNSTGGEGLYGLGVWLRRFNELGNRIFSQKVDTMRIGGGFDGSFGGNPLNSGVNALDAIFNPLLDRFYSWDAGYAFTENKLLDINAGLLDVTRVARALGPIDQCVNTNTTTRPFEAVGCVPLDVVGGPGSLTPEMLNYISYTAIDTSRQSQKLAYGNISTEIGELSEWLAGPLGIALGVEYRKEFFAGQPDPLKVISRSSTNSETVTRGSFDAKEAYMEFLVPVLADVTFDEVPGLANVGWLKGRSLVQDLELSLAGRYSSYSGFGSNFAGKLGIRYKPYEDLILRATISDAFRAPAITDLFLGAATSFPEVGDICAGRDDAARANEGGIENVDANCDADGVPNDVSSGNQVATVFGGNPNLEPETARTISAGFVYSPSFLPDFNMYLDWYSIKLDDFISVIGPDLIQELCYRSSPDQRALCQFKTRDSSGDLIRLDALFQNFASLEVQGIDFNTDYIIPLPQRFEQFGNFQWVLDAAYVTQYDQIVPTGLGEQRVALAGFEFGGFGGIPRWKVNTGLNWRRDNWDAAWNVRYIHRLTEVCDDGRQNPGAPTGSNPTRVPSLSEFGLCSDPNNPAGPRNEVDATFYNDVQASYSLPNWNTKLTFGVNNVLDQDPPIVYSAFADSYDKATHDPFGSRTPYARFQVNF